MLLIAASWVDEEFPLGCGEDQLNQQAVMWLCCGRLWVAADFVEEESGYESNRAGPSKVQAIIILYFYEQPILYVYTDGVP